MKRDGFMYKGWMPFNTSSHMQLLKMQLNVPKKITKMKIKG